MTREDEIKQERKRQYDFVFGSIDYCSGFGAGAEWADQHPHWISVEDEMPMELEPVLAAFGNHYARVCFYNGGKWYIDAGVMSDEAFGVSHWMPLPQAPKEGGQKL